MTTQDKDLAVAHEMLDAKDAKIARLIKTLGERDALCEQQTRTIHGIPALMQERDAEKARADDAEQMVCELRGVLRYYATRDFDSRGYSDSQLQAPADAALARTEPVAGRWVPVAEHADAVRAVISRQERIEALEAERDAAIAAKDAAEQLVCELRACLERAQCQHAECSPVETHNGCNARAILARTEPVAGRWVSHDVHERVKETWRKRHAELAAERDAAHAAKDAAESREHALGVQVVAAQAEAKRLLDDVKDLKRFMLAQWRPDADHVMGIVERIIAGGDAVPGDALAVPTVDYREASGVDVERVSVVKKEGE